VKTFTPRVEIAIVVATIVFAWALTRLVLYPALGFPDYAPAILRPILGFLAAWALLRRRGEGWDSLGLRRPANWGIAIAGGVALYLVNVALSTWAVPALAQWVHPQQQPSFMAYIKGDLGGFLLWAAIGWIVGAFIEECLFRGFLLTRIARLFPAPSVGARGRRPGGALRHAAPLRGLVRVPVRHALRRRQRRVLPATQAQPLAAHRRPRRVEHDGDLDHLLVVSTRPKLPMESV